MTKQTTVVADLQARIAELEKEIKGLNDFLSPQDDLDFILEEYGNSDEPMSEKASEVKRWMQDNVIKPKQRIAELETLLNTAQRYLALAKEGTADWAVIEMRKGWRVTKGYLNRVSRIYWFIDDMDCVNEVNCNTIQIKIATEEWLKRADEQGWEIYVAPPSEAKEEK